MKPSSPRRGTILIVDDEPNVLWFISKICQPKGYDTLTAASGMEGLRYIQDCGEKIDLLILDLRMPGMGGMEVLKSVRKQLPVLPVLILTAAHEKKEECQKLGVEAFIKKPYSLEELYQRIEAVMERRQFEKTDVFLGADVIPSAKILVVDDQREVGEVLSASLFEDAQDMDFKVQWVASGEEALRISKEFEPDIAIIDIKMPSMWGDELVRRFKAGEGHCPRDFVIYTNTADPGEVDRARKTGHKFLNRPTDLDTLLEALVKICVRHHLIKKIETR